jgi:serine/threonine-protein kinase
MHPARPDLLGHGDTPGLTVTPGRRTPPRCRVALADATGSHFCNEVAALLRGRLRLAAPIALFPSLLFLIKNLVLYPCEMAKVWPLVLFQSVVLLTMAGILILLWGRPCLSLRALRSAELLMFGLLTALFGWLQLDWVPARSLLALAPSDGERLQLIRLAAVSSALRWFFLIVLYGVFIPNTWHRCGAIVSSMALTALGLSALGSSLAGQFGGDTVIALGDLAILLLTAAAIAIFGSYRIQVLQEKAFQAQQLGQYRLQRRLGSGGMGEVYLAEHLLLRRPCALKLIRPDVAGDPTNLERFEREVRAMATLTHPNTGQVFDYGHADDGTFYYVMEYLPGRNLEALVDRSGPLPAGRAVYFVRQVCRALREAHGIGLLHRDIKPSNIIACTRGGEHDIAKLLDFGLVQDVSLNRGTDKLTLKGTVVGSPPFMSPEQAAGKELDPRSDIYGVGGVLFYLLTAQPPFVRDTPVQMLLAHAYEPPEPPSRSNPAVPEDLERVVLRCLAKKPEDRYPDAAGLEKALGACACAADWGEEQAAKWWRQTALEDTAEESLLLATTQLAVR